MQPSTPARQPSTVIDDHVPAQCDNSHQLAAQPPLPTPDTRADRCVTGCCVRGSRRLVLRHSRVYRSGPMRTEGGYCSGVPVVAEPAPGPAGAGSGAAVASALLRVSIRHPGKRAASRAVWPSFPNARVSTKSGTTTRAVLVRSSITRTETTFAGESAFPTNVAGSSEWSMMSIFSPASSLITLRTRAPTGPMHAPLALTPGTVDRTAILVRWPASRATE